MKRVRENGGQVCDALQFAQQICLPVCQLWFCCQTHKIPASDLENFFALWAPKYISPSYVTKEVKGGLSEEIEV